MFRWSRRYDPDAAAWFNAVAAAGGQLYSAGYGQAATRLRLSKFISRLKSENLWSSIMELGIVGVGVGNLSAALVKAKHNGVPLLTNNNFVNGDLTPSGATAGLKGDGATKYLSTGVNANILSQNNASCWVYITNVVSNANGEGLIGNNRVSQAFHIFKSSINTLTGRICSSDSTAADQVILPGLNGMSRNGPTSVDWRVGEFSGNLTTASTAPLTGGIGVFARESSIPTGCSLSLYGFGTSIDLAKLRAACDSLMTDFGFTP